MSTTKMTSAHERQVQPAVVHSAPVLITEQQLLLGSAAVVGLPAAGKRGWFARLRRVFASSETHREHRRRTYPPRSAYLEKSRMSREMRRL